ncbi:hypothetical protein EVAR_67443_1 [Eumeta japonica]|uniref:Uncharacterized protein n=1 Tax=Eumeta variegata TaxID=151549 RepID=A0A4C1ZV87_EUMVA|nr:hypothetical protein EVAR_67443_1 [Eumeta japonica]
MLFFTQKVPGLILVTGESTDEFISHTARLKVHVNLSGRDVVIALMTTANRRTDVDVVKSEHESGRTNAYVKQTDILSIPFSSFDYRTLKAIDAPRAPSRSALMGISQRVHTSLTDSKRIFIAIEKFRGRPITPSPSNCRRTECNAASE